MLMFTLAQQWFISFRLAIVPVFQRHLPGMNVCCKFDEYSLKPNLQGGGRRAVNLTCFLQV